jgi:hypothetical protein
VDSWSDTAKARLSPVLSSLKRNYPNNNDLWEIVCCPAAAILTPSPSAPPTTFERAIEELHDLDKHPNVWSNLWETWWKRQPGDDRLIALGRRWLREAPAHPAWTFVWEPLFLSLPDDHEFTDVALWWLASCGPRDRGAWTYVWKFLWDHGHATDGMCDLGFTWLDEFKLREHKYWWDVWNRLKDSGFDTVLLTNLAEARVNEGVDEPDRIAG